MSVLPILAYILIGLLAGFFGGLLGIGGGLIVVPALLLVFHQLGFANTYLMQIAIGTSLGAMLFTSASSAWAHYRQKGVNITYFYRLAFGVILGAIAGALFADFLSSRSLSLIFGLSVIAIGGYFLMPAKESKTFQASNSPSVTLMTLFGSLIGALSSILGIGGGVITVPILTAMGMPLRNAISTSAAVGFLIALVGALSFFLLGLKHQTFGSGYLYLPAFICIGITASLAAPYGARLTYIWPTSTLRRIFGAVLILTGISMLLHYY
ncbi:MAG: sulfite exporter TauE/SafE family protein [Parachlamydia sp.]|nr:sulfite exporter TauE/SafE family protein [Parachlamydia sp.]